MSNAALRELSVAELTSREAELRRQLFELKLRHNTGVLDSTADIQKTRREIARVLTVRGEVEQKLKANQD